jgi:hypothetical protein
MSFIVEVEHIVGRPRDRIKRASADAFQPPIVLDE